MIAAVLGINAGIGIIAGIIYYAVSRKNILCYSCEWFHREGGGAWKYYCGHGRRTDYPDGFDNPPKYCKYYKIKEEETDG